MSIIDAQRVAAATTVGWLGNAFSLTDVLVSAAACGVHTCRKLPVPKPPQCVRFSLRGRQARRLLGGARGGHRLEPIADTAEAYEPRRWPRGKSRAARADQRGHK